MQSNYHQFFRQLTSIISLAGISLLVTVPSPAKEVLNPQPSIFNQPPYNRGKRPSQLPVIKKPNPSNTEVPTVPKTTETTPTNTEVPTVPNTTESTPSNTEVPTVPKATETTPPNTEVPTVPKAIETTPTTKETQETRNIIVLLNSKGSFKTLIKALQAAELIDKLQGPGPFTIFAPTDTAFQKIPADALADLLKAENKEVLLKVLTYHVVSGEILSKDLKAGGLTTIHGDPIDVKIKNNVIEVNDAKVIEVNIQGKNGVIHVIDNVILPPSL